MENKDFAERNVGLVRALVPRFLGRGIEYDDLFQAGCEGLIKAAAHFDPDRGYKFSTYAVPVILGEMRRLFREGGTVKVSRGLKELSMKAVHLSEQIDRASEVAKLYGIDGCEIYNTTSGLPWNCRPYSGVFFDEMALLGHYLPCMAADDAHHYTGDETRSYIMVQADELTREGVLAAIRANRFYATQGPNFRVEIENGTVTVHTSPVQEVVFFTDTVWAGDRATVGENVTEATYKVQPTDTFVRVELKDKDGNCGWSGIYPVNKK